MLKIFIITIFYYNYHYFKHCRDERDKKIEVICSSIRPSISAI